ncbi:hypothetical protein ACQPU1_04565 [Clostridium paraputrificum]|uniref:hypothetical protein n=1 Tax=Clostridium TaxID=1485 RepID=UPI003D329220
MDGKFEGCNKVNSEYKEIIKRNTCYCCDKDSENPIEVNEKVLCRVCATKHFKFSSRIIDSLGITIEKIED